MFTNEYVHFRNPIYSQTQMKKNICVHKTALEMCNMIHDDDDIQNIYSYVNITFRIFLYVVQFLIVHQKDLLVL